MDHETFRNEIWETVRNISGETENIFSSCCEGQDLTVGQCRILFMLTMEPQMTVSALSRRLGIAPGNLSPLCKKLESRGLLERKRSQLDERVVEISLSVTGKKQAEEIRNQIDSRLGSALKQLTSEEMEQILASMKKMNALLAGGRTKEETVFPKKREY